MWSNEDVQVWTKALTGYPAAISMREKDQNKPDLVELDTFVFNELPLLVKAREPPSITHEEYCKVMKWKLKRGKWRPRLQKFADETSDEEIRKASAEAFKLLEEKEVKGAIDALTTLKGCGPATASSLLAAVDSLVPFMSDELLAATSTTPNKYTTKVYLELLEAVRKKANQLSEADASKVWTASDIEKAVFTNKHVPNLVVDQDGETDKTKISPPGYGVRQSSSESKKVREKRSVGRAVSKSSQTAGSTKTKSVSSARKSSSTETLATRKESSTKRKVVEATSVKSKRRTQSPPAVVRRSKRKRT